ELAETKKIQIMAVHLRTALGRAHHATAESQYKALTEGTNLPRALYYPVEGGRRPDISKNMEGIADVTTQLKRIVATLQLQRQRQAPNRAQRDFQIIGHAMALAYLGSQNQTQAPKMFEAWATDRDIDTPTSTALEVRVLLTKNQLSDLQQTIKRIIEAGKR